jgi:hypothetical protein
LMDIRRVYADDQSDGGTLLGRFWTSNIRTWIILQPGKSVMEMLNRVTLSLSVGHDCRRRRIGRLKTRIGRPHVLVWASVIGWALQQ